MSHGRKNIFKPVMLLIAFIIIHLASFGALAELKRMGSDDMAKVDAQGLVNFTYFPEYTYEIYDGRKLIPDPNDEYGEPITGPNPSSNTLALLKLPANTWPGQYYGTQTRTFKVARLEINVETEFYLEADSMKTGLSQRNDFVVRHNLFNHLIAGSSAISHAVEVSDQYQALWIDLDDDGTKRDNVFRGAQGDYDRTEPLVGGDPRLGPNINTFDWDLNFQNVRLGESNEKPFKFPNLVFKLYYDYDNRLRKVAFGSGLAEGKFSGNLIRYTGIVNPNLADKTINTNGLFDILTQIAKNPVAMKRDSFIGNNWQFFNFEKTESALSGDPMDHRGFWFVLANHDDHLGWEMVCGYNEAMLDFDYRNPDLRLQGYQPGH